jgi:hypothetical protein
MSTQEHPDDLAALLRRSCGAPRPRDAFVDRLDQRLRQRLETLGSLDAVPFEPSDAKDLDLPSGAQGAVRPVERFDGAADPSQTRATSSLRWLIGGFRTMRRSRKIWVAAAAAVAITFTGLASKFLPGRSASGLAFADVIEKIRVFRPYACVYTFEYEGKPPYSYREMHLTLSRRREVRPDGTVLVFDLSQQPNRTLILCPERKSAVEQTLLNTGSRQDPDFLRMLAAMRDGSAEDLGAKQVEGRLAQGFHRPDKTNDFTVWADVKTGLPVRIELVQPTVGRRVIMSEFEFDVDFDEAMFGTTAPEGYRVEKVQEDGLNPTERDLIEGLRAIATFLDGRFPPALDQEALDKAIGDRVQQIGTSPSEREMEELELKADRVIRFVRNRRDFYRDLDVSYVGEGVRLGDASSPVFWHRPGGSETCRVVYGDLSVRDVLPEDLPAPLQR